MKLDGGFNYAYMYGISDFWVTLFEDPALNQRVLEAESVSLSEVYSRFLQLTSTMSLEDISVGVGSDIALLLIEQESVGPSDRTFKLSRDFSSAKIISDRPFLPQLSLEQFVDYEIEQRADGSYITFSKPLLDYGFPFALSESGTWRFALWAADAIIDEQLISKVYAPLVRVDPDFSSNLYRDYVRGLFFLYTNGPSLALMEQGMSLAIGVPLARTSETVLLTAMDAQSGKWIVVTDRNSYTLPYNLAPTVTVGQLLSAGDTLSKVVEIKDYLTDSEWWLNVYIPLSILPPSTSFAGGGTAVPGSDIDYLMRSYLRTHTFLVKVNWVPGFNTNGFTNLKQIISNVKPAYTVGVYAWSVPLEVDEFETDDDVFEATPTVDGLEDIGAPGYMYRRDGDMQSRRGWFIRGNIDPDSYIQIDDVDTVDPDFSIAVSDYLGTPGAAIATTVADLMPLYLATETEIDAKLTALGVAHTLPLPDFFALVGNFAGNATALTRDLGAVPGSTEQYYSSYSTTDRELNFFRAEADGYAPETYHSFYMDTGGLSDPITLVFQRVAIDSPMYSVHAMHSYGLSEAGPYARPELPIPTTDELEILMV